MKIVEGLKYSKDHEWVKMEGNKARIGITDYAQHSLGEIVFVELPQKGTSIALEEVLGVVESVKAASDIYSPLSGTVLEINEELADYPGKINEDAFESWFAVLELSDESELENLMDSKVYEKYCSEGE